MAAFRRSYAGGSVDDNAAHEEKEVKRPGDLSSNKSLIYRPQSIIGYGMDQPAISFRGISKKYGRVLAVHDLQLDVFAGEVFGFLGLNGAGKTTSIRVLLDLLRPDRGLAFVLGRNCRSEALQVRAAIGYLPGEMGLYHDMTGQEILELLGKLGDRKVEQTYLDQLLRRFDLTAADLRKRLREYSTGMKRKLGIIQAFQGDPPVLILDEPTEGLDPLMQEAFYDLLSEQQRKGRTVFMSSHVLAEVERVCSRIGLLRKGELVLNSAVEDLRRMAARHVRVVFEQDVTDRPVGIPLLDVLDAQPREWRLSIQGPMGPLLQRISGLPVKDLVTSEPRLEDVLIRHYREGGK
jgi:ABC-2 type transport system ATP-binding protein